MSQIYSRAKQVLIWLGPAADGSDEVMDALAELGREFESVGIRLDVHVWLMKLMKDVFLGVFDEDSGREKRKGGIVAQEEKKMGKGIEGGIGVRGGPGTTCGGHEVVDIPGEGGGDGNATAGNSGEMGSRVDLGVVWGVGVADTEALNGPAVVCTTNKADASTGKTFMAVMEDGAARLVRLGLSEELQAFFPTLVVYALVGRAGVVPLRQHCPCVWNEGYMPEWDGVNDPSFHADIAGFRWPLDVAMVVGDLAAHTVQLYINRRLGLQQIKGGEGDNNPLRLLVNMYMNCQSSKETKLYRDRVYALLGLAADVNELEIKPDYSSRTSTAQILTEVAKAIIGKKKDDLPAELLSCSQFPKTTLDDGSDEQLPSWIPDWRSGLKTPFYNSLILNEREMFMACGPHRSVDMVPTTTAGVLGLRGYLVDTIEEVGGTEYNEFCQSDPRLYGAMELFFEKLDRLWEVSKQKNQPIYDTQTRRAEALWRVPVGDIARGWRNDMRGRRAKAGLALEYHKWRRTLELYQAMGCDLAVPGWTDCVDEDEKKTTSRVIEWVVHASGVDGGKPYHDDMGSIRIARKNLYLTEKGYMGMGPSNMQPADVVVVFPGARIPFVLRPTSEKDTFTYLGDAYCDGIMDGEITLREERREFFLV